MYSSTKNIQDCSNREFKKFVLANINDYSSKAIREAIDVLMRYSDIDRDSAAWLKRLADSQLINLWIEE